MTGMQANSDEPNWQYAFYGSNYPKLLKIKDRWDPNELLYGSTAVGGDRWREDGDGQLCRVQSSPGPVKRDERAVYHHHNEL